ncbi:hypothetical protein DSO57_1037650 [Entomophthora muscae]|uniref:Uncharacterized protein n=1 Tax=Entomophthora muscae TaxID=34485 RepID=A0ACC2SN24_9FUNG|nr:hypothetical protein DSO57_1037650 [Entomophthora muscae]
MYLLGGCQGPCGGGGHLLDGCGGRAVAVVVCLVTAGACTLTVDNSLVVVGFHMVAVCICLMAADVCTLAVDVCSVAACALTLTAGEISGIFLTKLTEELWAGREGAICNPGLALEEIVKILGF